MSWGGLTGPEVETAAVDCCLSTKVGLTEGEGWSLSGAEVSAGQSNIQVAGRQCVLQLLRYLGDRSNQDEALGVWRSWQRGQLANLSGSNDSQTEWEDKLIGSNFNKMSLSTVHFMRRTVRTLSKGHVTITMLNKGAAQEQAAFE